MQIFVILPFGTKYTYLFVYISGRHKSTFNKHMPQQLCFSSQAQVPAGSSEISGQSFY